MTLGDTNIETANGGINGFVVVFGPFVAASAGSLVDGKAYVDGAGGGAGAEQFRIGVYNDSSGAPGSRVAQTALGTVTAGDPAAWVTLAFASGALVAGNSYWTAIAGDPGAANVIRCYAGADASRTELYNAIGSLVVPDPWVAAGEGSNAFTTGSVYVDYTAGTAPTFDTAPAITPASPTLPVQGQALATTTGHATGDAPIVYAVQWYHDFLGDGNFTPILGATSLNYTPDISDVACNLEVVSTASNGVAPDATSTSNIVGPVLPASAASVVPLRMLFGLGV